VFIYRSHWQLRTHRQLRRLGDQPVTNDGKGQHDDKTQTRRGESPALAHTRCESWLQTSAREGFYELWSGTIADLLKAAPRKPD
jgi:hypothetical protein